MPATVSQELQALKKVKGRNQLDLYRYSYETRAKSTRRLGQSVRQQTKTITDEVRMYLVENDQEVFQHAFMDKEKRRSVYRIIKEYLLSQQVIVPEITSEELLELVGDSILGFGLIQPLIDDPDVTDILINGTTGVVYEKFGREITYPKKFESEAELLELAYKIVNNSGQSLTTANPMVDCQFPYIRINISLKVVSDIGTTITIRKAAPYLRASRERMLETNQATEEMLNFLNAAVRAGANILVAGATGSGKTELLKYMASNIPEKQRTLVIEDTPELFLHKVFPTKHFVPMMTRYSSEEDSNIDFSALLKNALRLNIKRLILGESRGSEALQMIEFFQSGHPGFTTVHAKSADKALHRLVMMCVQAGMNIDGQYIKELIADTFDLVIFQEKKEDGNRYITEVLELVGVEDGAVKYQHLYRFVPERFEKNEADECIQIHGQHIKENTMSHELYKKLKQSSANPALYGHLAPKSEGVTAHA